MLLAAKSSYEFYCHEVKKISDMTSDIKQRPLASMVIACYNQEWCIREALQGAFSQTYDPLEIVVSDDCSQDRTWDIVQEMAEKYIRNGGRHRIILNRNPENSYAAHFAEQSRILAHVNSLLHGEVIIQADGDDISLPERVSVIMDAWESSGRRADVFFSGSKLIDLDGRIIGRKSCYSHLSGSSMAYTKRLENFFGGFAFDKLHGDDVRFNRGKMLGGTVRIDRELVLYRVCVGYSQVNGVFRMPMVRNYRCVLNSRNQALIDVERIKDVSPAKYIKIKKELENDVYSRIRELPLWEADLFGERWMAYLSLGFQRRFFSGMLIYGPILLLPHTLGDPMLNLIHKTLILIRRLSFKLFRRR